MVLLLRLHAERNSETDIAFDHVAHIRQAIAELQRALKAHAEHKTGVLLRVDANSCLLYTSDAADE